MMIKASLVGATALLMIAAAPAEAARGPTDPEIAHIAYTAGTIDIAAAKQALVKSRNASVRSFARLMIRDHQAVNVQALALVGKLHVTPAANPTSAALSTQASATMRRLAALRGAAFDRAYVRNEAAYHGAVNSALRETLIPSADNGELKALLQTGLTLFGEHQAHADQWAKKFK